MSTPFERVFIIGAGLMGSGIAQVCAQRGLSVDLSDVSEESLERAKKSIAWSVGKLVEKGKVEGPAEAVISRISMSTGLDAAAKADLVVEAVFEKLDVKLQVFEQADRLARPEVPIASNTSAAATSRPEKVLGLHFFSPVPMMQAVEVVRGIATSDETVAAGQAFVQQLGKEPILVRRDIPGFLINRINLPSNLEAMRMVEQGVGTIEEIDMGLKLATGRKMGPFETGDMVGLDVTFGALMAIYEETRDPRWFPPEILRRKVTAGHLGRKVGRGWYLYDGEGKRTGPA
jgi:3-hydroxybutyryl-CoA dehydrogenase